jgi:hypothetical protein
MVLWVASGQLAVVSADGTESQAGWMLRVALPPLSGGVHGPCWAAWPCSQMMFLPSDVLWTDYSFLMCSQTMLLLLVVSCECWL